MDDSRWGSDKTVGEVVKNIADTVGTQDDSDDWDEAFSEDTTIMAAILDNKDALDVLNGDEETEGSVKKAQADAEAYASSAAAAAQSNAEAYASSAAAAAESNAKAYASEAAATAESNAKAYASSAAATAQSNAEAYASSAAAAAESAAKAYTNTVAEGINNNIGDMGDLPVEGTLVENIVANAEENARIADELIGEEDLADLADLDYFKTNLSAAATTQTVAETMANLHSNLTATVGSTSDVAGLTGSYLADEGSTIADHLDAVNQALENTLGTTEDLQEAFQGKYFQKDAESGSDQADDQPTLADALTNLNDNLDAALNAQTEALNDAQAANNAEFARIDRKIHKLETKMEKGLAANAALAGLVPLDHVHKTQISAALGGYSNNQALAVGAFHYLNNRTLLNAGAAYGGNDSISYKIGVTFGF